MASQLVGSSFASGALLPNYVNGRLLAAEDLATGQATLLRRDTMTGQAAGPGVVNGLWVTGAATALTVTAGLGLPPSGEPVSVPAEVTLPLSFARPEIPVVQWQLQYLLGRAHQCSGRGQHRRLPADGDARLPAAGPGPDGHPARQRHPGFLHRPMAGRGGAVQGDPAAGSRSTASP